MLIAQDAKPDQFQDSLQTIIYSDAQPIKKKDALFLLGEYTVQRHPELAEITAENLKTNYLEKTDSVALRRTNYIFAASHRWQGDYSTALDYYQQIYTYSKEHDDSLDIAKSAHFIGTISMFLGNNVLSQKRLIEAAKIYNQIGSATQKANINKTLASFYLNVDQLEKGKDQYLKALTQFEILKDSMGMSSVNANLGLVYTELGDFKKAEMHLMRQKALNAVFPTLREMGFHHDFLGVLRQKEGRINDAYHEHLKAYTIRKNLSSTYNLCESNLNMGKVLIMLNRYEEAKVYLKDVFAYEEHQSLNQQQRAYELLSEVNKKSKNYQEALEYYEQYKTISDSIYSKESIEIIAEKDAQYNEQKKDAEIILLNKEKQLLDNQIAQSRTIAIITSIGLLLLLIAAIALYTMYSRINLKNEIITKALKDRDLLLHETHHRVKNNLQMISSLLNLQSKYVNDVRVHEVLQNGRNRVQSMAILHKNLYVGDDLNMVNIQNYFEGLVENIFNSYDKTNGQIQLHIEANNIIMDIESVIPIGLIVNELVTNSLKHGFPLEKIKSPAIHIEMTDRGQDQRLLVKDNGIGINQTAINQTESFGQRLISLFTKKLKATITTNTTNGTEVSIIFPKTTNVISR
ncbi:MAG: histidine kinase dimerization/phosphoacceptor domain -containing protein [Psychroserpens sp.]|uniref:histidine kinase dimerization/phosphoacceptor domain -containing protein n=1 Tax=Psychroserpens sp. TaxID=2020870 RepID=UPI003C7722E4